MTETNLNKARMMRASMLDLLARSVTPEEREACEVAIQIFELHISQARAVERGEAVRIEIPIVVGPRGYLALEVDTAHVSAAFRDVSAAESARRLSTDRDYAGTPYVVVVHLPTHVPPVTEVVGEVTPC